MANMSALGCPQNLKDTVLQRILPPQISFLFKGVFDIKTVPLAFFITLTISLVGTSQWLYSHFVPSYGGSR